MKPAAVRRVFGHAGDRRCRSTLSGDARSLGDDLEREPGIGLDRPVRWCCTDAAVRPFAWAAIEVPVSNELGDRSGDFGLVPERIAPSGSR